MALTLTLLDSSSDDESESEIDDLVLGELQKKRKHRFWIENHIKFRNKHGEYKTLFMTLSDEKFENYYRLSRKDFQIIHEMIKSKIEKRNTNYRESISTAERLDIAIRYVFILLIIFEWFEIQTAGNVS